MILLSSLSISSKSRNFVSSSLAAKFSRRNSKRSMQNRSISRVPWNDLDNNFHRWYFSEPRSLELFSPLFRYQSQVLPPLLRLVANALTHPFRSLLLFVLRFFLTCRVSKLSLVFFRFFFSFSLSSFSFPFRWSSPWFAISCFLFYFFVFLLF